MKPIGLYLAEFKPLPAMAARRDFGTRSTEDLGAHDLETQDFGLMPGFDAEPDDLTCPAAGPDGIAEARQAGFAEGQAAGQAAMEAALEALRETHALERATERQEWAEQRAADMAQLAQTGLAALEADLAATLAEVIQPLLSQAARAKALADVRETIETLMRGDAGALIAVSGPADLAEPLRAAFAEQPSVEVSHAETFEVVVRAGDTTIRTHLQTWAENLAARLVEDPA